MPRVESAESRDWSDPNNWRPGDLVGGTPGAPDPGYLNPGSVVINEALTHSDEELGDWIELHNTTDQDIDISGWYLSDSDEALDRFEIPGGTVISAGGYAVFHQLADFGRRGDPRGFAINKLGDSIYLTSAAPEGENTPEVSGDSHHVCHP